MKEPWAPAYLSLISDPSLTDLSVRLFLRFNVRARIHAGALPLPGSEPIHETLASVVGDKPARWKKALKELCAGPKPKLVEETRDGERYLVVRTWGQHALGQQETPAEKEKREAAAERQRKSRYRKRDTKAVTPPVTTSDRHASQNASQSVTENVTESVTETPLSHSPLRSEERRGEETRDAGARESAAATADAAMERSRSLVPSLLTIFEDDPHFQTLNLVPGPTAEMVASAGDAKPVAWVLGAVAKALRKARATCQDEEQTMNRLTSYAANATERDAGERREEAPKASRPTVKCSDVRVGSIDGRPRTEITDG